MDFSENTLRVVPPLHKDSQGYERTFQGLVSSFQTLVRTFQTYERRKHRTVMAYVPLRRSLCPPSIRGMLYCHRNKAKAPPR